MKLVVEASDFNAFGCPPGNGTGHCSDDAIIGFQETTVLFYMVAAPFYISNNRTLIPALARQRLVYLLEFEASLPTERVLGQLAPLHGEILS